MGSVKIIECPRDAMQGIHWFIPTELKIQYLNSLLKAGFDTLDFGSFVSPKAIPQMKDTAEVLNGLNASSTKLLAIVANKRGADEAAAFERINYLGYPFSISETFQKRNTNSTITESLQRVSEIQQVCSDHNKTLVIYISMAFGNPYGDEWNAGIASQWVTEIASMGIKIIAMSDTVGVAHEDDISSLFTSLIPQFPEVEFGAHLHTTRYNWKEKTQSAWNAGCRRFDSAIRGFGGCPMAVDELTGNLATENLLSFLDEIKVNSGIDKEEFMRAYQMAGHVFTGPPQQAGSTSV